MSGVHLRYGWISRPALAAVLPASPLSARLAGLLERRAVLRRQLEREPWSLPGLGRDLHRALQWFLDPRLGQAPVRRSLRGAREAARVRKLEGLGAVLDWVGEAVELIHECEGGEVVPYDEMMVSLETLAGTDFPRLLLWSQPALASRLFVRSGRGVGVAEDFRRRNRRTTRAWQTCLAYALAGVGRLSPRAAWVGVGFGTF